jgi:hypothetical protein
MARIFEKHQYAVSIGNRLASPQMFLSMKNFERPALVYFKQCIKK